MTTLDTHEFWFQQAELEGKTGPKWYRRELSAKAKIRMLLFGVLLIPTLGVMAAFASSSQLDISVTGSAAAGADTEFTVIVDCRKIAGLGTVDSCTIAGGGQSIDLVLSNVDDDFELLLETTVDNQSPSIVCLQSVPLSSFGAVVNSPTDVFESIGAGGTRTLSMVYEFTNVVPSQSLVETFEYFFDVGSCV